MTVTFPKVLITSKCNEASLIWQPLCNKPTMGVPISVICVKKCKSYSGIQINSYISNLKKKIPTEHVKGKRGKSIGGKEFAPPNYSLMEP